MIDDFAKVVLTGGRLRLVVGKIYLATEADICRHPLPKEIEEENLRILTEEYSDALLAEMREHLWNEFTLNWAAEQINNELVKLEKN